MPSRDYWHEQQRGFRKGWASTAVSRVAMGPRTMQSEANIGWGVLWWARRRKRKQQGLALNARLPRELSAYNLWRSVTPSCLGRVQEHNLEPHGTSGYLWSILGPPRNPERQRRFRGVNCGVNIGAATEH